jgi:hemolysin-activating ACP:hemolysin acyltransferase
MKCSQFKDPGEALGAAVNLLRRVEPYASYPFGRFTNVLMGQIQRKHYVFTIDDGFPVGYVGWARCDEAVARAWVEGRVVPTTAACRDGDSAVLITFYAANRKTALRQVRYCRDLHPGIKVFGIRDYGTHRRPVEVVNKRPTVKPRAKANKPRRLAS